MQRIIKFRAWDKQEQEMIEDFGKTNLWELCGGDETEHYAVMQFTGLLDKKGVEIYEGDILDFDADEWGDPDFKSIVSWDSKNGEWSWGGGLASDVDQFRQVIGNIYANPELLGKETHAE